MKIHDLIPPPKLILFDNAQAKSECQFVPNLYGEPA